MYARRVRSAPAAAEGNVSASTLRPGSAPPEEISRLAVPDRSELPDEVVAALQGIETARGYLPNAFAAQSLRHEDFMRSNAFVGGLMKPERSELTPAERELLATVVSVENRCVFCILSHSRNLGELIDDDLRARRIAINYRQVQLSPRERALADTAVLLTQRPDAIEATDLDRLRQANLTDYGIIEVLTIIAAFNFVNRLNNALGVLPNQELVSRS